MNAPTCSTLGGELVVKVTRHCHAPWFEPLLMKGFGWAVIPLKALLEKVELRALGEDEGAKVLRREDWKRMVKLSGIK